MGDCPSGMPALRINFQLTIKRKWWWWWWWWLSWVPSQSENTQASDPVPLTLDRMKPFSPAAPSPPPTLSVSVSAVHICIPVRYWLKAFFSVLLMDHTRCVRSTIVSRLPEFLKFLLSFFRCASTCLQNHFAVSFCRTVCPSLAASHCSWLVSSLFAVCFLILNRYQSFQNWALSFISCQRPNVQ